ncbi:hypothetical protein I4U23_022740 [Adineta vaga]|nr:hypothetical protein I4U23_022740 [Adineta vaga]
MTTQNTSDFYWACRNGDLDTVKKVLTNISLNDINRIETNGSTALHAASYYGRVDIVRILLQRGASTDIRNKFDKTAKEEASTDEVRALFASLVGREETTTTCLRYTYRGLDLSDKDFEPYRWALAHPKSVLEMGRLTSTHKRIDVTLQFIKHISNGKRPVLLKIEFGEQWIRFTQQLASCEKLVYF